MSQASNGSASLHYDVSGAGTPVLMLLPQSSGPAGRQQLYKGLRQHHRVITYDQRGTGKSSPSTALMSMQQQADDAVAILDDAHFDKVHLFCHSTGCGIGIALASTYRPRAQSLTLVNPWTHGDSFLSNAQRLRIAAARALDPAQYVRFNAALLFPPAYRREHESGFEQQAATAVNHPQKPREIEQRLEAILAFDARPLLATISQPALVVSARDDQLMPEWFAKALSASLPDATWESVDGGGHMLPETRTVELLSLVLPHLSRIDATDK
jgi:pimeloyl-ACP methyl ester carboxylesterase